MTSVSMQPHDVVFARRTKRKRTNERKSERRKQQSLLVVVVVGTMAMMIATTIIAAPTRTLCFKMPVVRALTSTPSFPPRTVARDARMASGRRTTRTGSNNSNNYYYSAGSNGKEPFRVKQFSTRTTLRAANNPENDESLPVPAPSGRGATTTTPFEKLFQSTLSRAYSTTAALESIKNGMNGSMDGVNAPTPTKPVDASAAVSTILDATIVEKSGKDSKSSQETISSTVNSMLETTIASVSEQSKYANRTETQRQTQKQQGHHPSKKSKAAAASSRYEFPFATSYKSHPALNNVALAHALWASVVRPNFDVVIDATCGNGNDSIVLAEILFGGAKDEDDGAAGGELLCVDVQELACERTTMALKEVLPSSVKVIGPNDEIDDDDDDDDDEGNPSSSSNHLVKVFHASHEQLPRPTDPASQVGLVVYNLGWLPGSTDTSSNNNGKDCVTTMESTMASLVDATSLLRVGGMLSVVTYPQTGPDEDRAVQLFVTCLALLSSRTRTWQEEVQNFAAAETQNTAIANIVTTAMEAVVARGDQTWRVSQHDKLGMDRPPVLFTATRIK